MKTEGSQTVNSEEATHISVDAPKNVKKKAAKKKAAPKKSAAAKKPAAKKKTKPVTKPAVDDTSTDVEQTSETAVAALAAVPPVPNANQEWTTTDIPPVPVLLKSLINEVEGRPGTPAERDAALLAREMSLKHCHFCGKGSHPSLALATPWGKVELCSCMDRMRAYKEHLPGWQTRMPDLLEKAREGVLKPHETVYSDMCACGERFNVSVGMIQRSVHAHGNHARMRKCRKCREANMMKAQERQLGHYAGVSGGADHSNIGLTNADVPRKKKGKNHKHKVAHDTPLTATLGEITGTDLKVSDLA